MQLRLREDFNRFEGDLLRFSNGSRQEHSFGLDRIETRLSLTDA